MNACAAQILPDRNILQIGTTTGKSSSGCGQVIKMGMHPFGIIYQFGQRFEIGGAKFFKGSEMKNIPNDGMGIL